MFAQMLVAGSALQIYHPDNDCQYLLIAIFKEIRDGSYEFIDVSNEIHINFIAQF